MPGKNVYDIYSHGNSVFGALRSQALGHRTEDIVKTWLRMADMLLSLSRACVLHGVSWHPNVCDFCSSVWKKRMIELLSTSASATLQLAGC